MTHVSNRRAVLKVGAAAIGLGAAGAKIAPALAQSTAATPTPCVLTPEMTAGPFHVANELVRANITEGIAGLPLKLRIAVQDVAACGPLANAAVDIWHCDANGVYSGVTGANPGGGVAPPGPENVDTTFFRGIQITNDEGIVEFETIYPGWYAGRAVHIHLRVIVDGEIASGDPAGPATTGEIYAAGHTVHTGQLFFDDSLTEEIYQLAPYTGRTGSRTLNTQDGILGGHGDEPGIMLAISRVATDSLEAGLAGAITIGVDPTATPA